MEISYFKYIIIEKHEIYPKIEEFKDHRRLQVFYHKGCTCVECGIVGTVLALGRDKLGNLHWDIYADNGMALTVDHIIPRSCKGPDTIDNLQPMCAQCNLKKGNMGKTVKKEVRKLSLSEESIGITAVRRNKKNKLKEVGIVTGIEINPHVGKLQFKVGDSYYSQNRIYTWM